MTTRFQSDLAMHVRRTQVNQDAILFEYATSFVKGMDHALMRHSSQHPREHDQIKS